MIKTLSHTVEAAQIWVEKTQAQTEKFFKLPLTLSFFNQMLLLLF